MSKEIFNAIEKANKPYNAVTVTVFNMLKYVHDDMQSRVPAFGFEIMKWQMEKLEKIDNLKLLLNKGDRWRFEYWGIISSENEEAIDEAMKKLTDISGLNPWTTEHFAEAEAYREACKDAYKIAGATGFPCLADELVQFFQARDYWESTDGFVAEYRPSDNLSTKVRQILHVTKPVILSNNPGKAHNQVQQYVLGLKEIKFLNEERSYGVPKDFDVVTELGLSLEKVLFDPTQH